MQGGLTWSDIETAVARLKQEQSIKDAEQYATNLDFLKTIDENEQSSE
jgi:hypothetical protein